MSRDSVDVATELRDIRAKLSELLQRVDRLLEGLDSEETSEGWELIEASSSVAGFRDPSDPLFFGQSRIAEDGPLRATPFLVSLAATRLHSGQVLVRDRVQRCLNAGHWVWVALATHTSYQKEGQLSGLQTSVWVLLRGPGLSKPVRTSSKREAKAAVTDWDQTVVCEEFASFTEVQIFCLAARIEIPAWWKLLRSR